MRVSLPKGFPHPEMMLSSLENVYGSLRDVYFPPSNMTPDVPAQGGEDNGQGPGQGLRSRPGPGQGDSRIDDDYAHAQELDNNQFVEPLVAMSTQGWTDRQQYLSKQTQMARYLEGGDLHATLSRKSSNLAYSTKALQGARSLKVMNG